MQDFLLNIDNKEILIEILHHSIDYLIGNLNDNEKLCHKFGFQDSDDFMATTKAIAKCYRNCCAENSSETELLTDFANLSPELQRLVPAVLESRRLEILQYLRRHNTAQAYPLVESYDYDMRFIMGDSSYAHNHRAITRIAFDCRDAQGKKKNLHFEMDNAKLNEFIGELEKSLQRQQEEEVIDSPVKSAPV